MFGLLNEPVVVTAENLKLARARARQFVCDPHELADIIAMLGEPTAERAA